MLPGFAKASWSCRTTICLARMLTVLQSFPVVNRAPVLLNEDASIFSIAEFEQEEGHVPSSTYSGVKARISAALPNIDVNPVAKQNYQQFYAAAVAIF